MSEQKDTNETSVEELKDSVEEIAAEVTLEEKPEEKPKKNKRALIVWCIILAIVLLLAGAYYGVSRYYSDRFLMQTMVNGMDCAGMTVEEVEAIMQAQVEDYVLTITERDGVTEQIKGVDIGIQFNGADIIRDAFAEQNEYLWVKGLYETKNITAKIDFDYDKSLLEAAITELDCMKAENQVAPVAATPVYENGTFVVKEETYGSQIDAQKLSEALHASVMNIHTSVDLEQANCYVQPTYTKESEAVIAAKDALNKCLQANITYSLDELTVNVDAAQIAQWISVDENMALVVDETKVKAFTDTLGKTYDTPNTAEKLTTPTGKEVNVGGAHLGRKVGSAAECEQLIEEIKAGTVITREPILSQKATPEGTLAWGTTYAEVDLSAQHMWYISNGEVVFECDVVTGSPGRNTPSGLFKILEKLSPKTLRGNIMPNGKPEYVTPVKYWARVTWSGIGFHDAEWQKPENGGKGFGGTLYKEGYGSHGCINMAKEDVAKFYGMISVGCPVIIHY